jgi:excinuclease ABC subunit B
MDNVLESIYAHGQAEKNLKTPGASLVDELMRQAQDSPDQQKLIKRLEREMRAAAKELAFERAAQLRDVISALGGKGREDSQA